LTFVTCIYFFFRIKKSLMHNIKAIAFDLFNTLITVEPHGLGEALNRLVRSLKGSGLALEYEAFKQAHREAAIRFLEETRKDGTETHNRFWISEALKTLGYDVPPDDPRIAAAVDSYFSAFLDLCHLIPGTGEMLQALKARYRLGLLSNFTHAPAAKNIIEHVGLDHSFDVILISGDLGFRKPHPFVFRQLIDRLGFEKDQILYVGDDPETDITGAGRAGIQPVWTTYVRENNIPAAPGIRVGSDETPDLDIPRISKWEDLFSLLERE
jgi:putative hydrolase of the HAD superfamily